MITRFFDQKQKIMLVEFSGEIKVENVIEHINILFTEYELPIDLRVLEDARKATYDMTIDENDQILEQVSKYVNQFNTIASAFLQDKPYETAINLDYQYLVPFSNMKYKVFTTKEAALNWLLSQS